MEVSNGCAETFSVKKQKPVLVRPTAKTHNGLYFLSNLDQIVPYVIEIVFAFKGDGGGKYSAEVIKEALAKTLVEFYPLAGCLTRGWDGKMMVRCSGEGVPFVEAVSDNKMEVLGDITILDPLKLRKLVHYKDGAQDILDIPALTVQMTRFKCGGIVLGIGFNHVFMDGISSADFINSWAEAARGIPFSVHPYLDRSILHPRQPPVVDFPHHEYTKKAPPNKQENHIYRSFCLEPKKLTQLKTMATNNEHLLRTPTTFEVISALVWTCRTKALKTQPDQTMRLITAIDGRPKFKPPLPKAYFGNVIAWSCAECSAGEMAEKPLSAVVKIVQEALQSVTEDYVRSTIDYHEVTREGLEYENVCYISKWSRLHVFDVNFGWGEPTQVAPASLVDNLVLYLSQGQDSKNMSLSLGLPASAMEIFEELIHSELK